MQGTRFTAVETSCVDVLAPDARTSSQESKIESKKYGEGMMTPNESECKKGQVLNGIERSFVLLFWFFMPQRLT